MTQEGWTEIMYFMQDGCNSWVWLFFVAVVVLGAMFAIQLAIAVLCTHYKLAEEQVEDEALQERAERKLDAGLSRAEGGEGGEGGGKGGRSARSSAADDLAGAADQGGGLGAGDAAVDVERGGGGSGGAAAAAQQQQGLQRSGGAAAGAWQGLRARCFSVQAAAWFQWLSIAMVLANTLLLALWWSEMPPAM
jgi:hypothetical protein